MSGGTDLPTFLDNEDSESGDDTIHPDDPLVSVALEPETGTTTHLKATDSDRDITIANREFDRTSRKSNKPTDSHRIREHVTDISTRMSTPPVPDQTTGYNPIDINGLEKWTAHLTHHHPGHHVLCQVEIAWPTHHPQIDLLDR